MGGGLESCALDCFTGVSFSPLNVALAGAAAEVRRAVAGAPAPCLSLPAPVWPECWTEARPEPAGGRPLCPVTRHLNSRAGVRGGAERNCGSRSGLQAALAIYFLSADRALDRSELGSSLGAWEYRPPGFLCEDERAGAQYRVTFMKAFPVPGAAHHGGR